MKDVSPRGSNFKYQFVQCASFGAVVGVMEYYSVGEMLKNLAKKLGAGSIE